MEIADTEQHRDVPHLDWLAQQTQQGEDATQAGGGEGFTAWGSLTG